MEFKGTPSPWITRISYYQDYVCVSPEHEQMDFLYYKSFNVNSPLFNQDRFNECKANALLISKAPEMLEAMQEFCERVERGEVRSSKTYEKFKSIIKEATTL